MVGRFVPALPKTPTNKIQKSDLRAQGITADTWDREAAGMMLKRDSPGNCQATLMVYPGVFWTFQKSS